MEASNKQINFYMSAAHVRRSIHQLIPYLLITSECLEQQFSHCQQMKTRSLVIRVYQLPNWGLTFGHSECHITCVFITFVLYYEMLSHSIHMHLWYNVFNLTIEIYLFISEIFCYPCIELSIENHFKCSKFLAASPFWMVVVNFVILLCIFI
jgi:hypothetical protein